MGGGGNLEEGFFSSTTPAVDLGTGLGRSAGFLLDLCIRPMRREATPPEAMRRSQRGKRFAMLYTVATMFAKWSRMYSLE